MCFLFPFDLEIRVRTPPPLRLGDRQRFFFVFRLINFWSVRKDGFLLPPSGSPPADSGGLPFHRSERPCWNNPIAITPASRWSFPSRLILFGLVRSVDSRFTFFTCLKTSGEQLPYSFEGGAIQVSSSSCVCFLDTTFYAKDFPCHDFFAPRWTSFVC